jgi:glycosyltransferase involved in cell wall biosynthesis
MEQIKLIHNIVFHNPHTIWFKKNLQCFLNNRKSIEKYDYLFDEIYNNPEQPIITILLNNASSSNLFSGLLRFLNVPKIEFYLWVYLNNLKANRFKIITNCKSLQEKHIVLIFLYEHFTNRVGYFRNNRNHFIQDLKNTKAYKILHFTHYGYNIKLGSFFVKQANIDLFICENNLLKNSKFFNKFYDWYSGKFYTLPFVASSRFVNKIKFNERKNLAIASGTITHPMADDEFVKFYNSNMLQPIRNLIYNNKNKLNKYIDCKISPININENKKSDHHNLLTKILSYTYNDIENICKLVTKSKILQSKHELKHETEYYKFDIVDTYNNYKMFIVPEEIIDLPAIGFVEGMNCGSAFIGINNKMYTDIGLIDKINYIAYNGTLDDLINKINYYQRNPKELESIARNGYEFAKRYFNKKTVFNNFINYLNSTITNNG